MEFNNIKFIKNVLNGSQVKNVTIKKGDSIALITLKNNIVISLCFEKYHTYCNYCPIEHQDLYIEILKDDECVIKWQVFYESEQYLIKTILIDYVKSL